MVQLSINTRRGVLHVTPVALLCAAVASTNAVAATPRRMPCRYQVLEDTAEGREALGLDAAAAAFTGPSDMYMPLVDAQQPDSPQAADHHQQQRQHLLPFSRTQHQGVLPAPRGLGMGLGRRGGPSRLRNQVQQQPEQQQTLEMLRDAAAVAEGASTYSTMDASAPGTPSAAGGGGGGGAEFGRVWDVDEAAAMAVDGVQEAAEGVFADAVQVGPADLMSEGEGLSMGLGGSLGTAAAAAGLAAGVPAGIDLADGDVGAGGGFVFLRGARLGGAFEAVNVPHIDGGDEDMQAAHHGIMQLQFIG